MRQLFHTDEARSEAHDLADQHPPKVKELAELWMEEAKANNVLPLNDLSVVGKDLETFLKLEFNIPVPPSAVSLEASPSSRRPERGDANASTPSL